MTISQLARSIKASPTLKINEEARDLKARGEPVIHLGAGEPKNKAPIAALLGSAAKLNSGDIKYVPADGTPSLKKAIIHYTEENYNRMVAPENVIVSNGAKQAVFNVLMSLINPQDEVIILAPHWVSYPEMVRMVYGIPVIVTPEDGTFHPRMEDIKAAVSSYTKAIIVNSPSNPCGAVYSEDFIGELVEFCEDQGIYMICDDIYHKLVFDGIKPVPAYNFTKKDVEDTKVIVINGISKLYGMTGFRLGWTIGPRELVEAMKNIQTQTTSDPSVVVQSAAEGALTGSQSVVESLRLMIQNHRDVMVSELRALDDVRVIKPDGTFYCFPDFSAYNKNSVELASFLLKKALVATVPGIAFGMEGHLRLSFCGGMKDIITGIERIKWALDPKSPNEIYIGDRKMVRDWL